MATLNAIETRYKGYRFRSRLEARWAVIFDALHLQWQYEAQGLVLSNGAHYLPDFYMPCYGIGWGLSADFIEIKPSDGDLSKPEQLARDIFDQWRAGGFDVGDGVCHAPSVIVLDEQLDMNARYICWGGMTSSFGHDGKCDPQFNPKVFYAKSHLHSGYGGEWGRRASIAGRSARFEHGECPA